MSSKNNGLVNNLTIYLLRVGFFIDTDLLGNLYTTGLLDQSKTEV